MSPYLDSLLDLMAPCGEVQVRRMFSGHGFFKDGLMFAIAVRERFYLCTDAITRQSFVDAGCSPFTILRAQGKMITTKYYETPEAAQTNPQRMKPWLELAMASAERTSAQSKRAKSCKKSGTAP